MASAVPAALNLSLDDVIAARKAAAAADRGRARAPGNDDAAGRRRRRRGGRGRSGGGASDGTGARGGVDKLAAKRADVSMGDAASGKKKRRSGRPRPGTRRPLLPAHAVAADGALEVRFDGAVVARLAPDGTLTLDTTALADRAAARSAPLRRALTAAFEPAGVAVEGDASDWRVSAPGGAVAPFVDGMTVATGSGDVWAKCKAHLEAGRVAKAAGVA